jgi:hypothetical protein
MYDELVKRLQDFAAGTMRDEDAQLAFDVIEELSKKRDAACWGCKCEKIEPSVWIPVTEHLPEEHVFVLIRQDDDRMMVAERVDGDWWYRYFAYDVDRWDENEQGTITHWMPLPEPPKEEAT